MDKAHVIFSTSAFIVDHNWKDLLENCPQSAFSAILLAKSKSIKAQGGNAEVRGVKQNTVVILYCGMRISVRLTNMLYISHLFENKSIPSLHIFLIW